MIEEQIPAALAGERLDRIVSIITEISRSEAAALVAEGGACIDGKVCTSGKARVELDAIVTVDPALLPSAPLPAADPAVEVRILYQDDDLAIVDKQPGLVVHPGAGNPSGTLVNGLLARFPGIAAVGDPGRPGIVHRLDVGTSGVMAVALTPAAYDGLVAQLAAREVHRAYLTLVWGHLETPTGVIDAPIGRDLRDPTRMAVVVGGKAARTHYRALARFDQPVAATSLECRLETGRTHQIRVHMSAVGHPVAGDGAYGGARAGAPLARPFLHAAELELRHPVTGAAVRAEAPLPDDLARYLAAFR